MFWLSQAFSGWIQFGGFVSAGENLVRKLRALAFEGLLKQDIAWFDEDAHNSGALCATLAKEAALIQDVTGTVYPQAPQGRQQREESCLDLGCTVNPSCSRCPSLEGCLQRSMHC